MDSIRITERAWELILACLNDRIENGESQASLSKLIGCDRATVNRWLLNRRGGDRTTFKDMVRILDRLRIPLPEVFGTGVGAFPAPAPDKSMTRLDAAVAKVLKDLFSLLGKGPDSVEGVDPGDVREFLSGRVPLRASDLYQLCKAVGVEPGVALARAASLLDME
ncbi:MULTISPECIES: helix-turn-helix transcriptional regulator [unclassified Pseudodesulfovibrio]|uniref:helix-turn-helix domain-containing protein n=1 Tax=unclassified Pseudodesulfovibrio TaxID=2661612 RepID=UPI000FEBFD46|nr:MULTISPECIES: helix-turn-helix transcriptional regulator [unclassified Pseudodesulfovibrio]MCJ2164630.1 helix-turn-helix domain-containing protein [Pseudodesulfovibrio sp. S3-i]